MTILEQLREKKREWSGGFGMLTGTNSETELLDILNQYDLALENALLKLKNRGVEIADQKYRIKELQEKIKYIIDRLKGIEYYDLTTAEKQIVDKCKEWGYFKN